ncbi:hypothetical protein KUCAC02_012671, partial [Chaenocephalus aceratus]
RSVWGVGSMDGWMWGGVGDGVEGSVTDSHLVSVARAARVVPLTPTALHEASVAAGNTLQAHCGQTKRGSRAQKDNETFDGKKKARSYQRQSEPFEKPHHSPHWHRYTADRYREGFKACLERVSTMLPKTSLDQDACQRVNEFVQQSSSATVTPTCLNCCAQSSRTLPQMQQKLLSLKSSFSSRLENQSRGSSSAVAPSRVHPGPQAVSASMWRPW